jgi:hypothetical protein
VTSKKAEQIGGHPTTAPRPAVTLRDGVATSSAPASPEQFSSTSRKCQIGVNSFEKAICDENLLRRRVDSPHQGRPSLPQQMADLLPHHADADPPHSRESAHG